MSDLSGNHYGGRFQIVRSLGQGGQGTVHEVIDHTSGGRVALKTLRESDAASSARFKREFRTLRSVQHPSLIRLYELFEEAGRLFFTMELVEGRDFLSFVGGQRSTRLETTDTVTAISEARPRVEVTWRGRAPGMVGDWVFDEERLRSALGQLISAVEILHENGLVHRDIKPSNILLRDDGSLCLLDFGLVSDMEARESSTRLIVGTAIYMAPEQASQGPAEPAADWYAVGALLFQALTGRLPFDGTAVDVLIDKRSLDAPSPNTVVPDLPADLAELCTQLLRRDPVTRIAGAPWRRFARAHAAVTAKVPSVLPSRKTQFFGRQAELSWLRERQRSLPAEGAATVLVLGESGIGKTALLREFASQLSSDDERVVILSGRCYERESIHYKGVDGLVESLVRFLKNLPADELAWFIPRYVSELICQFPAFAPVLELTRANRQIVNSDALIARARAASALREILIRLGDRFPVVIIIDDAQWLDPDASSLLQELLRTPGAPRLLFVCSYTLLGTASADSLPFAGAEVLPVGPLLPEDGSTLACEHAQRLGFELGASEANAVAAEANGHPILVYELVRHASLLGDGVPYTSLQLDDVLADRIASLPEHARLLLELACVCETPLRKELVTAMSVIDARAFDDGLELLATGRFFALSVTSVQPSHDRIRRAVLRQLDAEHARNLHRMLARALERRFPDQVEALANHFARADELASAAPYAAEAARAAAAAFAFARASSLYALALSGVSAERTQERRALNEALAEVLASAGRSLDAAAAFLTAAELCASESESREVRRRAAEELLRSGHIDQGTEVLRGVLGPIGIPLHTVPRNALASLLYHRARLALRGMHYELRSHESIPAKTLQKIDACWSVASGLGLVDVIHGADFQTRGLLLALQAGEPRRLAQGLGLEAAWAATEGKAGQKRATRLLASAETLVSQATDPGARAWLALSRGIVAMQQGRFAECLTFASEAESILTEQCLGMSWQLARAQLFSAWALAYLGRLSELRARVPQLLSDYGARRDVFSQLTLKLGSLHVLNLADDQVATMRSECITGMQQWSQRGFHFQHMSALFTLVAADLYEGQPEPALERIEQNWPKLEASLLLRVQFIRLDLWFLRGRAALARLFAGGQQSSRRVLGIVRRAIGKIEREDMPWSRGLALALRAGQARFQGDSATALACLARAEAAFQHAELGLHTASCRLQAARIAGANTEQAERALRLEGVRRPQTFAELLIPIGGGTLARRGHTEGTSGGLEPVPPQTHGP